VFVAGCAVRVEDWFVPDPDRLLLFSVRVLPVAGCLLGVLVCVPLVALVVLVWVVRTFTLVSSVLPFVRDLLVDAVLFLSAVD
jgi:hypothetical protein